MLTLEQLGWQIGCMEEGAQRGSRVVGTREGGGSLDATREIRSPAGELIVGAWWP